MEQQGKTVLDVAARADEAIIVDMVIKAERYYAWRKVRQRRYLPPRHAFVLPTTCASVQSSLRPATFH